MKRALIVGINDYPTTPLTGCENDAKRIHDLLLKDENGDPNFECRLFLSSGHNITQAVLRGLVERLLEDPADSVLFYFSGHGSQTKTDGVLVTMDCCDNNLGLPMGEIIALAGEATFAKRIREVFFIIDCCHSGTLGDSWIAPGGSILSKGVSILTACSSDQVALESGGHGLFTSYVCDALEGGAADILGKVTAASIYSYLDQTFGAWDQRPLFKANLSKLQTVRECFPAVAKETLRKILTLFPKEDYIFPLSPAYEPTALPEDAQKEADFSTLQKYRASRLLVPIGEEHLYWAAMNSKSCKLTPLGRFYWNLVKKGKV